MSPILGIIASQNYPRVTNSYESIATATVGSGGTSSVSFSSIPSTYKHLQIRWAISTNRATFSLDNLYITINDDTGANYSWHALQGNGASASADGQANSSYALGNVLSSSAASNVFTAGVLDILDYGNTSKNKTLRTLNGFDVNGEISGYGGFVQLTSGNWRNTNAITKITFNKQFGSNFIEHSKFALYGIKD